MRSRLLRIEGYLNISRNIREVLQPEVLPLLQATPHATFQLGNARAHMARIVQVFFQRRRISLLPWPARSPDMSPIEHVWDTVGRRLIRQGPPAPTLVDSHTNCVQGYSPGTYPETLYPMPRRIETLFAAHGGFTPY